MAGLALASAALTAAEARPRRRAPLAAAPGYAAARAQLDHGRPLLAVEAARGCVAAAEDRDELVSCEELLMRSLSAAGRCDEVGEIAARVRPTAVWRGRSALAEGTCALRQGRLHAAVALFDEAMLLAPGDPTPRYQAAVTRLRLGEPVPAGVFDPDGPDPGALDESLALWQAWWTAAPDLDAVLDEAWSDAADDMAARQTRSLAGALLCQRRLELGDPLGAAEIAESARAVLHVPVPRIVACWGEALRRQGEPFDALDILTRPWLEAADAVALDAVTARALVDLGRVDEAAARLATLPPVADHDLIASRWYVAVAAGDPAADALARAHASTPRSDATALDALTPWGG